MLRPKDAISATPAPAPPPPTADLPHEGCHSPECAGGAHAGVHPDAHAGIHAACSCAHPHAHAATHANPEDSEKLVADALRRLREAGHRVTSQRRAMLQVLSKTGPVSIETLHHALDAGTADPATVYRSILIFEEVGIVQAHPLENGARLYCLGGTTAHQHHHHVICRTCGRMEEVDGCLAQPFEALAQQLGYTKVSHVFEIYGICPNCTAASHSA